MSQQGPEEPAAAADAAPAQPEVSGFEGTFEEAVEMGLIDKPPPLKWNRWQVYRQLTGSIPTPQADPGYVQSNVAEAKVYRRVQRPYYGPNFLRIADRFYTENPNWLQELRDQLEGGAAAAAAGATAPAAAAANPALRIQAGTTSYVHLPEMEQGVETEPEGIRPAIHMYSLIGRTPDDF